ncbi:hypothetical protein cypCar_00043686, partial [Cyprinus carpio]
CSGSCGEGIQQRQVICKPSEGQCDADKPESVSVCKLPHCTVEKLADGHRTRFVSITLSSDGLQMTCAAVIPSRSSRTREPSLLSPTRDLLDNLTSEEEKPAENTLDKDSNEPCLGDKSIFCQMEVLALYCSIPGYQKLCCESCNRKLGFSTLSPDVHPPFSWLPDFTFPPLPQTSPAPTQTSVPPLVHSTKAARRRPRPTSSSPKADATTSCPSPLPPDTLQIQDSLASTRVPVT